MAYPSSVTAEVVGARELSDAMTKAAGELDDLTRVNREVAQAAARGARSRAPVRTGELAASVTSDSSKGKATVRATAPHAGPIHWGVPSRGIAPNPFIVSAMVADESTLKALYERRLEELTKDMARST